MTSKKKKNNPIGSVIPSKHLPSASGKWHAQLTVQEHMEAQLTAQGHMDSRITVKDILMLN